MDEPSQHLLRTFNPCVLGAGDSEPNERGEIPPSRGLQSRAETVSQWAKKYMCLQTILRALKKIEQVIGQRTNVWCREHKIR